MSKYIPAEKLIAEIENFMNPNTEWKHLSKEEISFMDRCKTYLFSVITSLQQEQQDGIDGVVHHTMSAHWIVTNQKQLTTALKEFPEGSEVKLFIFARKEE